MVICTDTWQPYLYSCLSFKYKLYKYLSIFFIGYVSKQQTAMQINSLLLLQFSDWEEGRTHDEDPPSCTHYLIEWKVILNNRTVAKDKEQDLALAPRFHWRVFLQPKLKELQY